MSKTRKTTSQESPEAEVVTVAGMMDIFKEQQQMLLSLLESQKEAQQMKASLDPAKKMPKPTLQKLTSNDRVEHFIATFERIATQQGWPKEVWATQLAGLLTGKAMAAYAALPTEDALEYDRVKEAILQRYDINEESYRQRFRHDHKKAEESYREWADRLRDHFTRWTKSQAMSLEELIMVEQFLQGMPDGLRVWLRERKPESLKQAAALADSYVLARRPESQLKREKPHSSEKCYHDSHGHQNESSMRKGDDSHPPHKSLTNSKGDKKCYNCGKFGHLMYSCPARNESKGNFFSKNHPEVAWNPGSKKFLRHGKLNGKPVQMLIDTGCTQTMVASDHVHPDAIDHGTTEQILCVHGDKFSYPTAEVEIKVGGWKQVCKVVVAPKLPVAVLLGTDLHQPTESLHTGLLVTTRAQKQRQAVKPSNSRPGVDQTTTESEATDPLEKEITATRDVIPITQEANQSIVTNLPSDDTSTTAELRREAQPADQHTSLNATAQELKSWQMQDSTLHNIRKLAEESTDTETRRVCFIYQDGLLYRLWRPEGSQVGDVRSCVQLVLPVQCRQLVLCLAHDIPLAGHLGVTKTKDRVLQRYYWPGVFRDVAEYCRSCEVCQKTLPRKPPQAEMIPMPLMNQPFQRIAMDFIGPLPRTQRGNRYVLTICDYATRYPEAIPLPSMEAVRVAKELVNLFSHVGIPEEILSDQGANFMSSMLQEVYLLLNIKRIRTTPYHPQTDGLVERFNGTLKDMLRKFVSKNQKDWDEYLPYLLFAYREVPQESTGFSPFELLYGRKVRGPLDILRENWTGEETPEVPISTYVVQMRNKLAEMSDLVQKHARRAQVRQKEHYDRTAKHRSLEVGDKALVLLPLSHNRLKMKWNGPYEVVRKVTPVNYELKLSDRRNDTRVYHVNMLKKWHSLPTPVTEAAMVAWTPEESQETEVEMESVWKTEAEVPEHFFPLETSPVRAREAISKNAELTGLQQTQLSALFEEFPSVMKETPGRTTVVEHLITVGDVAPIRQKPYRIPYSQREVVQKELDKMLQAGVIRPSTSPWASPIVLVPKKDGAVRFCVDFRKLNSVAKFDAYPMPRVEEMIEIIGTAKVISTLDLAKGYWQIPMSHESKEKTAFTTPFGLYEFEVMPFGLHNAPATFQRMINYVLRDCQKFARAYIDDIVIFSHSWEEHMVHMREVLSKLQEAGLTLKLNKCQFGQREVHYLGHCISNGQVRPDPIKLQAIGDYPVPIKKKNVRAFLGLAGYYRRFVPHFATIAAPLTNLTSKNQPEQVLWNKDCDSAFKQLKEILISPPVLCVAEPTRQFILQTDASGQGLGAVLSQPDDDGQDHPVAYASRKLLPREQRYSVIEKECLAIVWALKVYNVYLYGQDFVVQTDHQPLSWLQRMKNNNPRLTRWALAVQPYKMTVSHRRGSHNGNADGLSRGPVENNSEMLSSNPSLLS